jgi:hypothetical protein
MSVWAQRSATAQIVKDKTAELQEQEASFRASFQPSKIETPVDSHGVKTVTEIKLNERGQQVSVNVIVRVVCLPYLYAWVHVPPVLPVLYPVSRVHTLLRSGTRDAGPPMSKGCV